MKLVIPVVLYILLDFLFGPVCAVVSSVLFSLCLFAFQLVKSHKKNSKPSYSHLFDALLMMLLGFVDIAIRDIGNNSVMAFVFSFLLLVFVSVSLFSKYNLIASLSSQLMGGNMLDSPYVAYTMRRSMRRMFFFAFISSLVFLISICCTECFFAVNTEWTIVILLSLYILSEIGTIIYNRYKFKNVEWVPLMSSDGKIIGSAPRPLVHNGSLWLHGVVHLHVFSPSGKGILLQKRPMSKRIQPGKWDTAVGGHRSAGEDLQTSLMREVWEEIGIRIVDASVKMLFQYVWQSDVEHEFVSSFAIKHSGPFHCENVGEVDELRFWSFDEVSDAIGKGIFTPNLEHELKIILQNTNQIMSNL